jgi:hypothetical protein
MMPVRKRWVLKGRQKMQETRGEDSVKVIMAICVLVIAVLIVGLAVDSPINPEDGWTQVVEGNLLAVPAQSDAEHDSAAVSQGELSPSELEIFLSGKLTQKVNSLSVVKGGLVWTK